MQYNEVISSMFRVKDFSIDNYLKQKIATYKFDQYNRLVRIFPFFSWDDRRFERRFRLTHGRYRFRFKSRRNIKQTVPTCSTGCLTDSLVCQRVACPPPSPDSCSHDWENAKEQQTTFCPIFCSRIATLDFPRINLSHLMRIGATGE